MNRQEHTTLTKVGAGTPMGEFMRRYWLPVAASYQVAEPDGAPLVTWLLGERLVVFRNTDGNVGVLDDHCLHRGVSIGLGRNEENGLRCIYHGWKFAIDGTILETPNHDNCAFRERKKAKAYPVVERSGLIWTYIGPADKQPTFRTFLYDQLPEENRTVFRANTKTSYLSMWEGGVDSSHVGVLHTNDARVSWAAKRKGENPPPSPWDSLSPTYEAEQTDYGYRYVAFRAMPDGAKARHARQTPVLMPNMRIIPGGMGLFNIHIFEVPMSDYETATYQIGYYADKPIVRQEAAEFLGFVPPLYDPVSCNVDMSWPHNMQQDRESMKGTSWSGYPAIEFEDVSMALSLNDDFDRSEENLVAADIAVVRLRQTLLNAVKKTQDGGTPPGIECEDLSHVVAYDRVVLDTEDWKTV